MNGKTAKLLNQYAKAKGAVAGDLKKQWQAMNAGERFARRQAMLTELKGNK